MDVLLIDPPWGEMVSPSTQCGYSVALGSLAAYLHEKGIDVGILTSKLLVDPENPSMAYYEYRYGEYEAQFSYSHIIWEKIADYVRQTNPTLIGITYLTLLDYSVKKLVKVIKETNPEIKIVVGSCHPTFCPDEVMGNVDIDFVIRGEGEIPLLHLAEELNKANPKLENVRGLHYRDNEGQVQNTPPADMITDLDELPYVARDLVINCNYDLNQEHAITTTRGCPFSCAFCADKGMWKGKVRRRSVPNVIEELKLLEDTYEVSQLVINDGTFTYDRKWLEAFCNAVIDEGLTTKWRCNARYDTIDKELILLMKEANCYHLTFGLESGSDKILKAMNKKLDVDQIVKVSEEIFNLGIPTSNTVMFGLPDETLEDMEQTLSVMKKVKSWAWVVSSYVPLPGSPLWDSMSEEEHNAMDWSKTTFGSYENYYTEMVPPEKFKDVITRAREIERLHEQMMKRLRPIQ